jgi:hypothetical protein
LKNSVSPLAGVHVQEDDGDIVVAGHCTRCRASSLSTTPRASSL